MNLAFEYDGPQHYTVIQKIESDKRKNELLKSEGIKLIRWPYYYMPTKDTCKYIFKDNFSDQKFILMLESMFGTVSECDISSPGFHGTPNIPANFIWQGINKFINELEDGPVSILHQVRYSLKLYVQAKANINSEIVIPTYHKKFMELYNQKDENSYLNFNFKNRVQDEIL